MDKILNILPKIGRILGIVISGILVILLIIRMFVKDPEYRKDAKKEQKILQGKIDSIYLKKDSLNGRIANLEQSIVMFYDIIDQANEKQNQTIKEIKNLRKYFNEKIKAVDRYNISDLDSFFKSRYPQYYE